MNKNVILGISSTELNEKEKFLLKEHKPYGIILFKRNCDTENQVKKLNHSIKDMLPNSKILIDQEGGRVARLKQPNFLEFPAANKFKSKEEIYDNYFIMGKYLHSLEIDTNCAPVADLYYPEANNIIGDRSFGETAEQVADFALAAAEALMDAKIAPIIKHIPGHGRALVDSHLELPIVTTDLLTLEKTDFYVFKKLNQLPMAMTAHIIYTALDPSLPVTISRKSIEYIRQKIGFGGLIISDDLNMKALKGSLRDLTKETLESGCNIALHCSGIFEEMEEVVNAIE